MSAISKQQRVKGEAFLSEAESTLAKKTWFASSSEQKHEDAAELYCKAANAFKVGGFFTEAGDAYGKAAKIYQDKLKNGMEASKALTESGECWAVLFARFFRSCMSCGLHIFFHSLLHRQLMCTNFCSIQMCTIGHCYKKIDAKKAIEAFRESISMLCDAGRLTQAARLSKETAELFENDGGEDSIALAIQSYKQAADLYDM
jgi:alpha-soluble NSF attachment protein